jgi:hypothetical protein
VIGWPYEVTVELAAGETDLWFAVGENVEMGGGWALQAAFVDPEGLSFVECAEADLSVPPSHGAAREHLFFEGLTHSFGKTVKAGRGRS